MKKHTVFILSLALLTLAFVKHPTGSLSITRSFTDTMPHICTVLPGDEIASLQPFTTPFSGSFPDPNNFETYNGCHYQFFKENVKPQLAVRMIKWGSKKEAMDEYKMQVQRHFESWGIARSV